MATYQNILKEFQKHGLTEQNNISKSEMKRVLDRISAENAGVYEFNSDVANEIWDQTQQKNQGSPVKVRDYIVTMVQAQNILRDQINKAQNDVKMETDEAKKQQLLSDLFSFTQDHRTITSPFGLQQIRQTKQIQQSKHAGRSFSHSKIFDTQIDERQQTTDVKVAFVFNSILLLIQLTLMFHKHHFFTLLCIFLVYSAFFLNYFDRAYVKFLLGCFLLSIVFDLVWLIVLAAVIVSLSQEYWNPQIQTQHSTIHTGFLRFIVFFVCVQMLLKIIIACLFIKYRAVGDHVKKKATLFGQSYNFDGKLTPDNLVSQALPQSLRN